MAGKKIITDLSQATPAKASVPTPANPGTYLPIPGQVTKTNDQLNAEQIKNQNSVPTEGATSINDVRQQIGASDGKQYTGAAAPITDAVAQKIQEYTDTATTAKGPKGDKGDKGDAGPRGPAGQKGDRGDDGVAGQDGVVDYDRIRDMIAEMLAALLPGKALQFVKPTPTQVFGTRSINLPVELLDQLANTSQVVSATYTLSIPSAGSISASGVLTGADVSVDTLVNVVANYTDSAGKNYTANTNVTIKAYKVTSLSVSGPSTINSSGTGTYAATANYTDGTTKVVTTDTNTTWSIASGTIGTLNKNVLTAPTVSANASGQIRASYVEKGTTVTGTVNVTIAAPSLKGFYGAAAHPVAGTSANPSAYDGWGAFVQTLSGVTANSSKNNTFSINQSASQYGWYAYPKSFGIMTEGQIKGAAQPGPGSWDSANAPNGRTGSAWNVSGPLEISVTINGSVIPFYLYRTDNVGVNDTWTVS